MKYLALVVLSGCGRLAFDPAGPDAGSDDGPPASDLALHFTFEPASFLDELAGGHDATCTTCPMQTTGHTGGGAHFDGVNNCLLIAYDIRPAAFTYALWENTLDVRQQTLFGKPFNGQTNFENSFEMYAMGAGESLYLIAAPTTLQVQRSLGSWHHVAAVFDGNVLTTYLDGVQYNQGTPQAAVPWAADPFRIGCDMDNGVELGHYFGTLDDVRFYTRALSAAEIMQLAME